MIDPSMPWNVLTNGNIFGAVIMSYTNVMGLWFYMFIIFLGMMMVYFKTNNFTTAVLTGILEFSGIYGAIHTGVITGILLPELEFYIMGIVALGMSAIIYKLLK